MNYHINWLLLVIFSTIAAAHLQDLTNEEDKQEHVRYVGGSLENEFTSIPSKLRCKIDPAYPGCALAKKRRSSNDLWKLFGEWQANKEDSLRSSSGQDVTSSGEPAVPAESTERRSMQNSVCRPRPGAHFCSHGK